MFLILLVLLVIVLAVLYFWARLNGKNHAHELKNFEHSLIGTGSETVVFLNGFGMKYETWDKVSMVVAEDYNVLLYNRLGVGLSSRAHSEQLGGVVVGDMHELFKELEIQRPFLIVAHSFGGIFANLYARTYPDDVLGVVFVDATHPDEVAAMKEFNAPAIFSALNNGLKRIEKVFNQFKYSEAESMEQTVLHVQNSAEFPNVPIAVVTGTKNLPFAPQKGFDVHLKYQHELLNLSHNSRHYLCEESSHFPQFSEPEIVVTAIHETFREVQND